MSLFNPEPEENFFERILGNAFPPSLGKIDNLVDTHDYQTRLSRTGVDNQPKMAHGRIVEGSVKFKRIFYLPGRCV